MLLTLIFKIYGIIVLHVNAES